MTTTMVWRIVILATAVVAAYSSSLQNRYALDDDLVIGHNIIVQRGIRGVPEIFTADSYAGFYETYNAPAQLAGGRYRPLALATFAVEQSLFGTTLGDRYRQTADPIARMDLLENDIRAANLALASLRHAISVLLYAASMVALLLLLEGHLLREQPLVARVAAFLFALHPIHTEVVANVKSRDEILSFLFIVLSLLFACRYSDHRERRSFTLSLLFFFLALLSKEYAVMLPFVLLVALAVAKKRPPVPVLREWIYGHAVVLAAYFALRWIAAGVTEPTPIEHRDLLNDPFLPLRLGEMAGDVAATKIALLAQYLRLLVWPHPLSADYSFATFPFANWADLRVWFSIAVHMALLGGTFLAWRRRHPLATAGCIYFAFLFPVSNLAFDIGATLGERLVYHASLGFVIAVAWALVHALRNRTAVVAVTALISIVYGSATFARSRDWYDDATLFLHDVKVVPNSAMVNGNAGARLTDRALLLVRERRAAGAKLSGDDVRLIRQVTDQARPYLQKALALHPRFANAWVNLGLLHWTRDEYDDAAEAWERAAAIHPSHPVLRRYGTNFHAMGTNAALEGDLDTAIAFYERATRVLPQERYLLRDLAGASFAAMQFSRARAAFDRILALDSTDGDASRGRYAAAGLEELEAKATTSQATAEDVERFAAALAENDNPAFKMKAAALRNRVR